MNEKMIKPISLVEKRNMHSTKIVATWDAKRVTLGQVVNLYESEYPPMGYGTRVSQIGKIENNILTTEMTRYNSCE